MKLTEEVKKRIDDYFSELTDKELLHINENYFNKPLEAINYTQCCKSDSELLSCDEKCEWEQEHTNWFKCKVCGMVEARTT